jgi:molecular chaperone DnaJ
MATKRDYYEVLSIARDASDEDVKKAFRRLAMQYHPDRNREDGAEAKFKEMNEAYEVLSDPDKRAAYDRFGHVGAESAYARGFEGFDFGGFGDIFDAFFGGMTTAARKAPQRGADLRAEVTITLEDAAFSVEKEIEIVRTELCSQCRGTGARPGTQPTQCPNCNGSGQIRRVQQSLFGRFINTTVCSRCQGEGKIIADPCPQCRGAGRERYHRRLKVNIPAGIGDGSQMRLTSEGEAGLRGGSSGDLYISVSVRKHDLFVREDDSILYELPVNFAQAALGAELEVPTLYGKAKLLIPPGSQTGKIFKLKNQGMPHLHRNGRGDQLVRLFVATPDSLTKEQRQLFEELAKTLPPAKKTAKEKEG